MKTFERLNKNEMKMIVGGTGTCCYTAVQADGATERTCGLSRSEAIAEATGAANPEDGTRGFWCCASC